LLDLGTPRQQAVLAALLVDAGRPVSAATLIDRVWDEQPPARVRGVLYSLLGQIRRLLASSRRCDLCETDAGPAVAWIRPPRAG
jgi:DNA-binding SARP family transcriptional activator